MFIAGRVPVAIVVLVNPDAGVASATPNAAIRQIAAAMQARTSRLRNEGSSHSIGVGVRPRVAVPLPTPSVRTTVRVLAHCVNTTFGIWSGPHGAPLAS